MNFEIVSNKIFKVDFDFHRRIYSVKRKRNGFIKITNVLTGLEFLNDVRDVDISINNEPMTDLADLQKIVFNKECLCDDDSGGDEFKIFDRSFDKTFE